VALKSTIYKAEMSLSDIDRGVYGDFSLTVAKHPSETDERMMVRILAYALHASHDLQTTLEFGKGISNEDEPALCRRDLTGAATEWIEVGLPDEKLVRRACGKADRVWIYTYGGRGVDVWWRQNESEFNRQEKLTVLDLPSQTSQELARMATRSMVLNVTVQEGQILFADERNVVNAELRALKAAGDKFA